MDRFSRFDVICKSRKTRNLESRMKRLVSTDTRKASRTEWKTRKYLPVAHVRAITSQRTKSSCDRKHPREKSEPGHSATALNSVTQAC
jgi:hypothetical protein